MFLDVSRSGAMYLCRDFPVFWWDEIGMSTHTMSDEDKVANNNESETSPAGNHQPCGCWCYQASRGPTRRTYNHQYRLLWSSALPKFWAKQPLSWAPDTHSWQPIALALAQWAARSFCWTSLLTVCHQSQNINCYMFQRRLQGGSR